MPDGSPRTPYRGKGGRGRGRTGWMEREGGRRRRRRDGGREAQPDGSVARASERAGAFIHLPDCPKRPRRYTLVRVRRPILQRILANIFATRRLGRFFYCGICSPLFKLDNFTFLSIFQAIKWPNMRARCTVEANHPINDRFRKCYLFAMWFALGQSTKLQMSKLFQIRCKIFAICICSSVLTVPLDSALVENQKVNVTI